MRKLFQSLEYCYDTLNDVRAVFTNKDSTPKQWEKARFVTGLVLLYGPERVKDLARGHLIEMTMREALDSRHWNKLMSMEGDL